MNDELLKAIRLILKEELDKQVRPILREELDKERQVTRADMRDLQQEMHEGFARLDKRIDEFKLEMRFRLKHIDEVLTEHDARLANVEERLANVEERLADHDVRLLTLQDDPEDDDSGSGNGREG